MKLRLIQPLIYDLLRCRTIHAEFRSDLASFIDPDQPNNAPLWSFKPEDAFSLLNQFIGRLNDLRSIFNTASEFAKLERVEIGGTNGRQVNMALRQIAGDFETLYMEWNNVCSKHDILDVQPELVAFAVAKQQFDVAAGELMRKMATQLSLAFAQCYTTTQLTTLMQMCGTLMQVPVIGEELNMYYGEVVRTFGEQLDAVKRAFDQGVRTIESEGAQAFLIDPGQAPVSGVLKWIAKLRARLMMPASNFPYLEME